VLVGVDGASCRRPQILGLVLQLRLYSFCNCVYIMSLFQNYDLAARSFKFSFAPLRLCERFVFAQENNSRQGAKAQREDRKRFCRVIWVRFK
jgi:hypothetical protein